MRSEWRKNKIHKRRTNDLCMVLSGGFPQRHGILEMNGNFLLHGSMMYSSERKDL